MQGWAERLESGGLEGVLRDVSSYARRRPGMFLLSAAGVGFLAGRLTRAARAGSDGGSSSGSDRNGMQAWYMSTTTPAVAPAPEVVAPGWAAPSSTSAGAATTLPAPVELGG
jgi:hypothetical protein